MFGFSEEVWVESLREAIPSLLMGILSIIIMVFTIINNDMSLIYFIISIVSWAVVTLYIGLKPYIELFRKGDLK